MTPAETGDALQGRLGSSVREIVRFRDEVTATLDAAVLVDACRFCRDELGYNFLSDVSCTDWLDRDPRFDVVYHLMSLAHWNRFRIKVRVNDGERVPTVIPIWGAANWGEREVWDLFGIEFEGHPNLRRLLLPEDWVGFPLRKDYPQTQIALPRPKGEKSPV